MSYYLSTCWNTHTALWCKFSNESWYSNYQTKHSKLIIISFFTPIPSVQIIWNYYQWNSTSIFFQIKSPPGEYQIKAWFCVLLRSITHNYLRICCMYTHCVWHWVTSSLLLYKTCKVPDRFLIFQQSSECSDHIGAPPNFVHIRALCRKVGWGNKWRGSIAETKGEVNGEGRERLIEKKSNSRQEKMDLGEELRSGWKTIVLRWHMRGRGRDMAGVSFIWCLRMLTHSRKWRIMENLWKCLGAFSRSLCARAHTHTVMNSAVMLSISSKVFSALPCWTRSSLVPSSNCLFCAHFFYIPIIWCQITEGSIGEGFFPVSEFEQQTG